MIRKLKNVIFFPWCIISKYLTYKKIEPRLSLWLELYKTRIVKINKLNLNQTRYLEGRSLVVEILKNKWYRYWIPIYVRLEFYSGPFRLIFDLIKNYLKSLYSWWKLELKVYVFHLEEVRRLNLLVKGFWNIYFFVLVGLLYIFIYGLTTIYLMPICWKIISYIASESYIHNLKGVVEMLGFFFHIVLIILCWDWVSTGFGLSRDPTEDVTKKIRNLDLFDEYDPDGFYKKVNPSFGEALSQGGFNLSDEEKGALKNRLTENWKVEWLGIEPVSYELVKLGQDLNYSKLMSCRKVKGGLKIKDLYNWKYIEKFLKHGKTIKGDSLEEIYEKWGEGFEKVKKLVDFERFFVKEDLPTIKLERGLEEPDVIESVGRYCVEMPEEEELEFNIFPLEPELELYGLLDDFETGETLYGGSDYHEDYELDMENSYLNFFPEELEEWADFLRPFSLSPIAGKIVEEQKGGESELYKNLDEMVFRRVDLIRSEMVSSDRKDEGLYSDWYSIVDAIESIPPIFYDVPIIKDLYSVEPLHAESNVQTESHGKVLPKDPRLSVGLAEEYDREVVLIDEIYQKADQVKGKTLVEMELDYLNTEEVVPWSKVVKSGLDTWFDEPYEIYFARAGIKTAELFATDEDWEEEEFDDETTLLVEEDELGGGLDEDGLSDYVAIAVAVFSYVWLQSYTSIGYMPVREIKKLKNKEDKDTYYIVKGLEKIGKKLRRRKRMVFTRRYVKELRQNQGLREDEGFGEATPYDSEAFYYVEGYDRYDMVMELDYGHVVETSHLMERKRTESFGMEMDSGVEGFYQIIDFSYTFWGTGWRLIQLAGMFLLGLFLTVIDWSTGVILSLGTWYLDYWWPFLSLVGLSTIKFCVEAMTVLGSILGYSWDLLMWIVKGYEVGVLKERAAYIVRAPWGYEYNGTFEDFGFHRILLDYWKTYPFSFGHFDIRSFFWNYLDRFHIPTKFFVVHGRNLTGIGMLVDECLVVLDLFIKIFDGIFIYSWCMAGVIIKSICYVLVFSIKVIGILLHYVLTGLLKLIALVICIF